MKNNFKFEIGERVYVVGLSGTCVVSGRGVMNFISGGISAMYQICGARPGYYPEHELLTVKEFMELAEQ
jgi:hypothetical protein